MLIIRMQPNFNFLKVFLNFNVISLTLCFYVIILYYKTILVQINNEG